MRMQVRQRQVFAASILFGCILIVISYLSAQTTQPSPSPAGTPGAVPSPSPSIQPVRTPSPTPSPVQNFHRWGSITLFNGLPSDSVRAIAQTLDGVMWFGTENGLARFDGRRVQNFSVGDASSDRVTVLRTASGGDLWIGTANGAFIFREGTIQPISGTENRHITAILPGATSLLATDNGQILGVIGDLSTASEILPEPLIGPDGSPQRFTSLIETEGEIHAGTAGGGIYRLQGRGTVNLELLDGRMIRAMALDKDGGLWLGTDAPKGQSGIYRSLRDAAPQRISAPTAIVQTLEASDDGVWAGTERYGLFHFDGPKLKKTYTFENTSGGLRSDTVYALFTDREGVLWIGTNRGVSRFDRLGPIQQTVSDIPNSNFIRTLYRAADGRIYAGSNRGLFVQSGEKWLPIGSYANQAIYAISEDRSGRLLIGSSDRQSIPQDNEPIEAVTRSYADFRGAKYAAVFGSGLSQIGPGAAAVKYSDPSISSVCSGADKLWIGTAGKGLLSFDGSTVKSEVAADQLPSGMIRRVFEDAERTIWVGGEHGVFRVKDGQAERVIEATDVRDLYIENGQVWAASTTRGLLRARNDERFGWLVSTVGFEQGMPSEKAFSILPSGTVMMIATNRGIVSYRSGVVAPELIPARVLSQRVHELNELRAPIELGYPQRSLIVEVAGQSSRTFPEEFQYGFILEDSSGKVLDKRLSNVPQYAPAGLGPGSYVIKSWAFDRDLLSSDPMEIAFSIAPAPFPWTATALGALLVIALIALIWAVIERRHISQQNRELAAARSDLVNEAERERSRIARDLHDQTLADLRNLMLRSDRLIPADPAFRNEIEDISMEIRRICEDLSPSVLENVGLVPALEFMVSRTIENHRFSASEDANERIRFPLIVQLHIYRIAQEVVANIKRHSDADFVNMNIVVSPDASIRLTISDNGSPFEPSTAGHAGRGISNIRARASIIRADIAWTSRKGKGNEFSLFVKPLRT